MIIDAVVRNMSYKLNNKRNYSPLLATACQTGVNDEESKQQPDI